MIVSFAWTSDALVARLKTVTRRFWKDGHAAKFRPGMLFDGYDKLPHSKGKKIATLRVISIRKEKLSRLLLDWKYGDEEIRKEGGLWRSPKEFVELWVKTNEVGSLALVEKLEPYRLEFEIVSVGR